MPRTPVPPLVLAFAGADPTCGAGLQADLLTLAALGCHPLTVATALTVQDTAGVAGFDAVAPDRVEEQARTLLADMSVAVFKVGMMASVANVAAIAAVIADHPDIPVVLDPVLASGRGEELSDGDIVAALRDLLLPRTTVLTPNSVEARRLARAEPDADLGHCALELLGTGCEYVLATGTHEDTAQVINSLYGQVDGGPAGASVGLVRSDAWPRLPGSYHGSGCTLASALAALLARGLNPLAAAHAAQEFTWQSLAAGFQPGMGQFIPDRMFASRDRIAGTH
ncbi:MAG: hydroxymethylpyrimidine/phosphomethylpyrimidine kinase [Burkholderiales bacterium]|nr:hydroxymethylpyrimidine/phosphomethylpyrimidine kinase [Burkholderiales bacterium]